MTSFTHITKNKIHFIYIFNSLQTISLLPSYPVWCTIESISSYNLSVFYTCLLTFTLMWVGGGSTSSFNWKTLCKSLGKWLLLSLIGWSSTVKTSIMNTIGGNNPRRVLIGSLAISMLRWPDGYSSRGIRSRHTVWNRHILQMLALRQKTLWTLKTTRALKLVYQLRHRQVGTLYVLSGYKGGPCPEAVLGVPQPVVDCLMFLLLLHRWSSVLLYPTLCSPSLLPSPVMLFWSFPWFVDLCALMTRIGDVMVGALMVVWTNVGIGLKGWMWWEDQRLGKTEIYIIKDLVYSMISTKHRFSNNSVFKM